MAQVCRAVDGGPADVHRHLRRVAQLEGRDGPGGGVVQRDHAGNPTGAPGASEQCRNAGDQAGSGSVRAVGFGTLADTVGAVREPTGAEPTRVIAAVVGPPVVAELLVAALDIGGVGALAVRAGGWIAAAGLVVAVVVRPLLAQMAAERLATEDARCELDRLGTEVDFRERVGRALTQAGADEAAMRAALRAVHEVLPDADVSLLLAVPDQPRVGWKVRLTEGEIQPARPIPGTPGCSALAGNTIVATDSTALDSCEHMEDPDMTVSATCVPLRIGERLLGVVSAVQAPGEGPDQHQLQLIEWVVERTGARISELRRSQNRHEHFATDATTGLAGPDALESHLRDNFRSLVPFCVSLIEIDDFPGLVHLRSPSEVDEVLRTLADSLRLTLRPDDVITQIDRGRFAVLLVNCGATHASLALERVRESLALSLSVAEAAPFTFSAGVVESHRATSIDDLLEQGRSALRLAHGNGGNRVALAHD